MSRQPISQPTTRIPRRVVRAIGTLTVLVLTLSFAVVVPAAHAQSSVVGTADFRNAPQLPPGEFVDRIVTGDSAWYAVIYTNSTPYEFEVAFQGQDPGDEVDLSVSFVAPTLTTVDGPGRIVTGAGVDYPAGHTNEWFLKVTLETTGQTGVEYPVIIRAEGVQELGTAPCTDTPGCTLDDDYASNNVALTEARAELERLRQIPTRAAVEAEIENARSSEAAGATFGSQAQARLEQAEARMAELCAPDSMCEQFPDQGSTTPLVGWIVGLAALGFGLWRAVVHFRGKDEAEDNTPPPRQPAALSRNRAG